MEIISNRRMVTEITYEIFFQYTGATTLHGFGFPASESGEIDLESMRPAALANYFKCLKKEIAVDEPELKKFERHYHEPAVGKCQCGCEVVLDRFTNTCDCGRDYNMSGQLLADRSQWGEETGETYSDICDL